MKELFSKDLMTSHFLYKPISMDSILKIIEDNI
jgi:hypothetical protein